MSLFDAYRRHVSRPYVEFLHRIGMDFEAGRASGAVVEDRNGRKYIDCIGGYGNLNVGHNHPRVVEAMTRALEACLPFGWPFISEAHSQLVEKLQRQCDSAEECRLLAAVNDARAPYVNSYLRALHLLVDENQPEVLSVCAPVHPHVGRSISGTLAEQALSRPRRCGAVERPRQCSGRSRKGRVSACRGAA